MNRFLQAHATHPDPHMALALAAAQIEAQRAGPAADAPAAFNLGLVYLTDHYAAQADALLAELRQRWPDVAWVGGVGIGVVASGVECFDEPALVLLLGALPAGSFTLFNGERPLLPGAGFAALVHADGHTPDIGELIHELAARTDSGYLFGGLTSSRTRQVQICAPAASAGTAGQATPRGVYAGGISGVAFGAGVPILSRVTQGCQPIGPVRQITAAEQNLVQTLDDQSALPLLLGDLKVDLEEPRLALPVLRATLVGLSDAPQPGDGGLARRGQFGTDTRVRHLIGLDPGRGAFAVAERVEAGMRLAFCQRDVDAARRDLVRICAELRDELTPDDPPPGFTPESRIAAAIYISCAGRGGPHFGGPSAELHIIRHALGDVPLAGFFAGGEIARHHLYGYTGVLTLLLTA
jgi:small ligand-binding sensory domain FIST